MRTRMANAAAFDPTAGTTVETSFQAKFQTILEINRNLGTTLVVDEMLSKLLDGLFKMFPQTDRGYVLLASEPDGRLNPEAFKDRKGGAGFSSGFFIMARPMTASRAGSTPSTSVEGGGHVPEACPWRIS